MIEKGKAIRKRRRSLDMTQRAVAHLIGISNSHLSDVETGRRLPSVLTIARLEAVLGINLTDPRLQTLPSARKEVRRLVAKTGRMEVLLAKAEAEIERLRSELARRPKFRAY